MKLKLTKVVCIIAATLFSALKANGQDTIVLKILEENAPNYFNAPGMPRFSVIGKEREFYLGVGGTLRGTLSYDFGNPIESPLFFTTNSIPMNNPAGNGALVQMSAASSGMFFNFVALPHTDNKMGAYIHFNFSGNDGNYGFSLKEAYITYRNLTVGYNTSLFTDGAASAGTIDQQGPNAMTFLFNMVVDYQYKLNERWKIGAGLERPVVNGTLGAGYSSVNQRLPDIPVYAQYSWKNGEGWLRLSGLLRNMYYRSESMERNEDIVGWGVKLSGAAPLNNSTTLYYQGVYGSGIASYVQDMQGLGMDFVPLKGDAAGVKSVDVFGMYTGLQHNFSPKFTASTTFSMVRSYLPDRAAMPGDTYKSAVYVVANIFYRITPVLTTGIEYIWGCRRNVDGAFKQNNRLQIALRGDF